MLTTTNRLAKRYGLETLEKDWAARPKEDRYGTSSWTQLDRERLGVSSPYTHIMSNMIELFESPKELYPYQYGPFPFLFVIDAFCDLFDRWFRPAKFQETLGRGEDDRIRSMVTVWETGISVGSLPKQTLTEEEKNKVVTYANKQVRQFPSLKTRLDKLYTAIPETKKVANSLPL